MVPRMRLAGVLAASALLLGPALADEAPLHDLPPEEVSELVRQVFVPDPIMRQQFLMILRGRDNPDVVPGLIQVLRFVEDDGWIDRTLAGLTGAKRGKSWKEWMLSRFTTQRCSPSRRRRKHSFAMIRAISGSGAITAPQCSNGSLWPWRRKTS